MPIVFAAIVPVIRYCAGRHLPLVSSWNQVCCSVLQRVAACCSVLQRVVACCSMLQLVAACCNVMQCVAACRSVFWRAIARCCVMQCVAVCCSVVQCVAVCCKSFALNLELKQGVSRCVHTATTAATHCNALQHTATTAATNATDCVKCLHCSDNNRFNSLQQFTQHTPTLCKVLQRPLQHLLLVATSVATQGHCNTL